jgi:hypothetical protein
MKELPEEIIRLGQLNNLKMLTKKCPLKFVELQIILKIF